MAKSLIKIIAYFGQWPEWINFYLESCKWNSDIHWLIYTDCPEPENKAKNVFYKKISFEDYCHHVSSRLKINFCPDSPYKLCDLKPAFGFIHENDIAPYDCYAFGDIDIIYGNIRKFLTDELLTRYQLISTHTDRISGHFVVFENSSRMRNSFRQIPNWKQRLENRNFQGICENTYARVFLRFQKYPKLAQNLAKVVSPHRRRCLFKEQYSTILSPMPWSDDSADHPQTWLWNQGKLTNTKDGDREYCYLHFMNWKSNRYLPGKLKEQSAAWQSLPSIVNANYKDNRWLITPSGFIQVPEEAKVN
jgi:hypothetical protein